MTKVTLCSEAERDFADSLNWYADRDVNAAVRFEETFERALAEIARDPERFPKADDRHRYYLMNPFPFQILFRFRDDGVYVITVAHTSRSSEFWKNR